MFPCSQNVSLLLRYVDMNQPNMTIYDNGGREIVQQEERWLHTRICSHLLRFVTFAPPITAQQLALCFSLLNITQDLKDSVLNL